MTTKTNELNIKNVIDILTEQDFNNHDLLKQFPDIKKVIVMGLKSEIRIINNMGPDSKFKEQTRRKLTSLGIYDLNGHITLFNSTILMASTYIIDKASTMSELINRLVTQPSNVETLN
jgi:hypothetical protein